MNKVICTVWAVLALVVCSGPVLAQEEAPNILSSPRRKPTPAPAAPAPEKPKPEATNKAPPAPVAAQPQQVPPTTAVTPTAPPVATAAIPAPAEKPKKPIPVMDDESAEALMNMRETLAKDFTGKESFDITEEKMIAFVWSGLVIEKINSKWDVQIASADTDQMAIEYNGFAAEELDLALQKFQGITTEEYQELVQKTVSDKGFLHIYQAYKVLVQRGYFGEEPEFVEGPKQVKPIVAPTAITGAAMADVPMAPPRNNTKPQADPADSGTVLRPQGSPTPQYSQQPSR